MKLILAIMSNEDSPSVSAALTKDNFQVTRLATTGGFLRAGNTTLIVGTENDKVERVEFTGTSFTMTDLSYSGNVCVRYYAQDAAAKQITIYADMLPKTVRLVMEAQLCSSDSTTNRIGTLQIEVPRASMTGAFTLSMTPDSVAQTPLSVRALSYTPTNDGGCTSNRPVYATITEILYEANWYDNVIALAIEGGDVSLAPEETKALKVFAVPNDGSASFLARTSGLSISSASSIVGNSILFFSKISMSIE